MTHLQTSTKKRVLFIDQIKALMIALVIAVHVTMVFSFGWNGVYIPIDEALHPFFAGVVVWLLFFCNSFFYVYVVSDFGIFCPALGSQERGGEVPQRAPATDWSSLVAWPAVDQ